MFNYFVLLDERTLTLYTNLDFLGLHVNHKQNLTLVTESHYNIGYMLMNLQTAHSTILINSLLNKHLLIKILYMTYNGFLTGNVPKVQ